MSSLIIHNTNLTTTTETPILSCYHCGDKCPPQAITMDDKSFCCQGCATVYQILANNNMCEYYQLNEKPGQKTAEAALAPDLDLSVIESEFTTFKSENLVTVQLSVPSIHCASCLWLLENLGTINQGVCNARVDFVKKEVTISFNPKQTTFDAIVRLMEGLGYPPSLMPAPKHEINRKNRNLWLKKMGVAGFCAGNIMILSFPEYLGMQENPDQFRWVFGLLNILFSLPVMFFSASEYFTSSYQSLRHGKIQINVPLALGMSTIWLRSVYEVISGTGGGFFDSLTGLIFFLLIGKYLQQLSFDHLTFEREAGTFFPLAVRVKKGKEWITQKVFDLAIGDIVKIRNHEIMPADGVLMKGTAQVDYSFVTGEALPVEKQVGEMLYGGGRQVAGEIEMEVVRPFTEARLQQLWKNATHPHAAVEKSTITTLADTISGWFTLGMILIAVTAFVVWLWIDTSLAFYAFTSVLIVACPCALVLAAPFAFTNAVQLMARKGFYLKNVDVVEDIANVNHIVFDKTGTLTHPDTFSITFHGDTFSEDAPCMIASLAAQSIHPYSRKIAAEIHNVDLLPVSKVNEVAGKGIEGEVNGHWIQLGSASFVKGETCLTSHIVAEKRVWVSIDAQVVGYYEFVGNIPQDVRTSLQLLAQHTTLSLLSGDTEADKTMIANTMPGIFSAMTFQCAPAEKSAYIQQKIQEGKIVMMVGDGLNDAGALSESHVGVVVTDNLNYFSPASSALLLKESIASLPLFQAFSQKTVQAVKEAFAISLIYNGVGMYFATTAQLSPVVAAILMPVSSISITVYAVIRTRWIWTNLLKKSQYAYICK